MNELIVKGTQNFMGKEIPVIEGGFGVNCKVTTGKVVSEIHNVRMSDINASINRLIHKKRIKDGIDYINLLSETVSLRDLAKEFGMLSSNRTKDAFILSERGYMKLIKAMDDDDSWDIMDKFVDEYFRMREVIKNSLSAVDAAMLRVVKSETPEELMIAMREYNNTVVKPLQKTIDYQKPIVSLAELRIDKKGCYSITDVTKSLNLKKGKITRWAKQKGLLHKTQNEVNKCGEKFFKVYSTDGVHNQIGITDNGLHYINEHIEEIKAS